jgi:hypothetical protein
VPIPAPNTSARVLLCLYTTGGSASKVEAQLETFADTDTTIYVTHPSNIGHQGVKTIDLGREGEAGGFQMLYRKTLRLMHHLANESNG